MPAPTANSGFTLIEIIIVLLLVGITTGIAVISLGDRAASSSLRAKAQVLEYTIAYARDYGLSHQQALGVMLDADRYYLVAFDEQKNHWQPLSHLSEEKITDDITLALESELALRATSKLSGAQPTVLVYPDGWVTPFTARFEREHSSQSGLTLALGSDGVMRMQEGE